MSRQFEVFRGSFVYVLTRTLRSSVTTKAQGVTEIVNAPIVVQGFLIEECESCYYLGEVPDEITDSVTKSDVVRVFLPVDEMNDALVNMAGNQEMN